MADSLGSFEDMRIEVAAHRLVIRAILTYMACTDKHSAGQTLSTICGMLEGVGPYAVIAEDLDQELRHAAMTRAHQRMANFAADIQKLSIARA
jgi:hypothetical protein